MKRFAAVVAVVGLFASPASAITATWTGNMEFVTTVTYKRAIRCEYNSYAGTFWQLFVGRQMCPYSVEVE